jgi:O-methyltransferase involved in polyketide biosynthesis
MRDVARASRAFLIRSIRYLAGEAGIRQFLDIGTGLPTADNTHQVAQRIAPEARIVYVDKDPMVLAYARALLTSTREGATAYIDGDLSETDKIIAAASQTLDFTQPIALILSGILGHITNTAEARSIVQRLMDALPPGSYLALSHPASDLRAAETGEMTRRLNQRMSGTLATLRDRAQVAEYFAGLNLVPPGLVQPQRWRPRPAAADDGPGTVAAWCGVARTGRPHPRPTAPNG